MIDTSLSTDLVLAIFIGFIIGRPKYKFVPNISSRENIKSVPFSAFEAKLSDFRVWIETFCRYLRHQKSVFAL
jgi:hypothetical protein